MGRLKSYWNKGFIPKVVVVLIIFVLLFLVFLNRDNIQPVLLGIRKFFFVGLVILVILSVGLWLVRATRGPGKLVWTTLTLSIIAAIWYVLFPVGMFNYMSSYAVFKDLNLVEIDKLPLTQNERIQPWNNVVTMAYEAIAETEEVSHPQLVRIDNENRWTMAIQPAKEYFFQRMNNNTEELFSVPTTEPFPRFAKENRIPQVFSIGESLAFSRNSYNAVVQRFNLFQLFSLQPDQLYYMKNDQNEWVQVISLIRWEGFFFPYPSFGGVMVLDGGEHDIKDYFERLLIGKGTYISPEEMANYPYLHGQNTMSEKVSRIQAESLKFLAGFTDPLPWNKLSAVKIPQLEADQNQQPFVTDFVFNDVVGGAYDGLYHWFGLEPIGEQRTSLTYSVMIPADGSDKVYFYDHGKRKEGLAGVSAMPAKVIESKKQYDWNANSPVEFRPFVKDIGGKRRMFMLSTIVAKRTLTENEDGSAGTVQFDGAATPDLALIDVQYKDVIWIDAKKPSSWEFTILEQMGEAWGLKIDSIPGVANDSILVN